MNQLYVVNIQRGPHQICAGVVRNGDLVCDAADVFGWMIGKMFLYCEAWILRKRGRIDFVGYCA